VVSALLFHKIVCLPNFEWIYEVVPESLASFQLLATLISVASCTSPGKYTMALTHFRVLS
jgi:hypothetical protein